MDEAVGMTNVIDGGEAILEALRNLGVDYVISSPGSEWAPIWEAFARQKSNATPGPTYIDCGHETHRREHGAWLHPDDRPHAGGAVARRHRPAAGLDRHPRRAVFRNADDHACPARRSATAKTPTIDPGTQWHRSLSVVGGPQRLVEPFVKWANQATSFDTLYQSDGPRWRNGAARAEGPAYLNMPMETMMDDWTPPERMHKVEPPAKLQPSPADVERIAALIRERQVADHYD